MSFNPTGRAFVDPSSPRAFAVCDRCGRWYNHNTLQWQYEWAGTQLINLGELVCEDCLDIPQIQLKTIILPPDPPSILSARVEPFSLDEDDWLATQDGDGITTQDGDVLTPQIPNPDS